MIQRIVNSAPTAFIFAGVVFGSTAWYAYTTAVTLFNTGSNLLQYLM